jgi:hypothetical protein
MEAPIPLRTRDSMTELEYECARGEAYVLLSVENLSQVEIRGLLNVSEQFVRRYIIFLFDDSCKLIFLH